MYTTSRTRCRRSLRRRENIKKPEQKCPPGWTCGKGVKGNSVLSYRCPPGWICGPGYSYNMKYYKNVPSVNDNTPF